MKLISILSLLISLNSFASWQELEGTFKASDSEFCEEFMKFKYQKLNNMPEIFIIKSSTSGDLFTNRFAFAIGEWGVGSELSFSYETKTESQGHFYTLLRLDANKTLKYQLSLKIVSSSEEKVQSYEMRFNNNETNYSQYCFYERIN